MRWILVHVGDQTTPPIIASARSPPLVMNGQQLAAAEGVFEESPELEFDETASLRLTDGEPSSGSVL